MRVGIDIGGTKALAIALDDEGAVVASRRRPTQLGPDGVVATAMAVLRDLAADLQASGRWDADADFETVGVGIPGRVDPDTGTVTTAVNLRIGSVSLGAELAARLGCRVRVENDVKASALGAASRFGIQDGMLSYLNLGTGVAAATVLGGRLLRGVGNTAGELGHVVVDPQGDPCPCGQRGCLETLAGGAAIDRRLAALGVGVTLAELFTDDWAGHAEVVKERDRVRRAVALALTTTVIAYGPDVVAVGGGVVDHAAGMLPAVADLLRAQARQSPFLDSLHIDRRVRLIPPDWPVAAVGAALVGASTPAERQPEPVGI